MPGSLTNTTASIMSQSLAPVFMLTAIAAIVAGMSHRYGRVIDRTRTLLRDGEKLYGKFASHDYIRQEVHALYKRARILRNALVMAASAIVFVVSTVFFIFLDLKYAMITSQLAESAFLIALIILLVSICLFISDFVISLGTLKLDIHTRGEDIFSEINK